MIKKSYYPDTNSGRLEWWQNALANYAIILARLPDQAASILLDIKNAIYCYGALPQTYDTFSKQRHGYIQEMLYGPDDATPPKAPTVPAWPDIPEKTGLAGIERRRIAWVQALVHTPNWDKAVEGAAMRTEIIGGEIDLNTYQGEIVSAVSMSAGHIEVKYRKARGAIDGMEFSGQKVGTQNWTNLGRFTGAVASLNVPISTPGQPEEWAIRGQPIKNDKPVGLMSDIKMVMVRG